MAGHNQAVGNTPQLGARAGIRHCCCHSGALSPLAAPGCKISGNTGGRVPMRCCMLCWVVLSPHCFSAVILPAAKFSGHTEGRPSPVSLLAMSLDTMLLPHWPHQIFGSHGIDQGYACCMSLWLQQPLYIVTKLQTLLNCMFEV